MTTGKCAGLAGLAALLAGSALAQAPASAVINGDTLRYNGATVHRWGIDAPEKGQTCSDGWQAGGMAADYLAGLIHNRRLASELKPPDQSCQAGRTPCARSTARISARRWPGPEWRGLRPPRPRTIRCRSPMR
ncbi:hypothetical protein BH10PSE6_BH10PSE6_44870 [soil metagenome]